MKFVIIAAVVLVLIVGAIVVKLVVFSPENMAYKLYQAAEQLAKEGDSLYLSGDSPGSKTHYDQANEKLSTIIEKYKETLIIDSAITLSQACSRRLGAIQSPTGAVKGMVEAISATAEDYREEYLTYWDFDSVAAEVVGTAWNDLEGPEKEKFAQYCRNGTVQLVDENRDLISLVKVRYGDERIEGEKALVETEWEAMNQKSSVPFSLVKSDGLWKVYDFQVGALGGGPAAFLRQALERCAEGSSVKEFISSADFEKRYEACYMAIYEEMQEELSGEMSGGQKKRETWTLNRETDILQEGEAIATLPAGTPVDRIQESTSPEGQAIVLISSDSTEGAPLMGWVPAENLSEK